MTLITEIDRPISTVFRRASIRARLLSTGLYETSWRDITRFVKDWGNLDWSIDDVRKNRFKHSGITLRVRNDTGAFNPEGNLNSLWYSTYMTRYRTLVRVETGYYDTDGTSELPTDPTQGIFILDNEIPISAVTNDAVLQCSSLQSIFEEERARNVAGLGVTLTASGIITRIRDHTDGAGQFIFRQFITSTAWNITTTTNNFLTSTDTTLEDFSCWELMEKLAEAEGFVLLINRTGGIEFKDRVANTTTSQYSLRGQGFDRPNIIRLNESKEPWNKVFTFVRLKYLEADTSTSFVSAGTTTTIDGSNASWKLGQRVYNFENTFINNTTTAQGIVNSLFTDFSEEQNELSLDVKMAPQIELLDRVDVSYRSYDLGTKTLWDGFQWDEARWSIEGENFDLLNAPYYIISKKLNLNQFSMALKLREI